MVFSKTKNSGAQNQPKGPSLLGFLFAPDVSGTFRPMRESVDMFIKVLAMVFASQGLFPRNHPAILGARDAERLSLARVIATAWGNLVFTRDNAPKVFLFFAVIFVLVCSGFAAAAAIVGLFVGKAHAAGFFSPWDSNCSDPSIGAYASCQDLAINWINYLFNDKTMYNYVNSIGQVVPSSTVIQDGLMVALGTYSSAMMVVAAVILFYHLATMIVNTAHHGVVLGKDANQVWAPIRLVFAVGLLIPIAGGLNTGQYIVLKVAEWGSNMADNVWASFVDKLAADSQNGRPPVAPYVPKVVYDTIMSQACAATYNAVLNGWGSAGGLWASVTMPLVTFNVGPGSAVNVSTLNGQPPAGPWVVPANCPNPDEIPRVACNAPSAPLQANLGQPTYAGGQPASVVVYDFPQTQVLLNQVAVCGGFTFAPPKIYGSNDVFGTTIQPTYLDAAGTAYDNLLLNAAQFVDSYMPYFISPCLGGKSDQQLDPSNDTSPQGNFDAMVMQYAADLTDGLAPATNAFATVMGNTSTPGTVAYNTAMEGWASAGAWFNTIARMQLELMDVGELIPSTISPQTTPVTGNGADIYNKQVLPPLEDFRKWVRNMLPLAIPVPASPNLTAEQKNVMLEMTGTDQGGNSTQADPFDEVFAAIDKVAAWNGVWQAGTATSNAMPQVFSLGVQFNGNNPFAEIVAFGHANVMVAKSLYSAYIKASGYAGAFAGVLGKEEQMKKEAKGGARDTDIEGLAKLAIELGTGVATLLGALSVLFFGTGFMMAYYLPLIPFFYFLFNVITWIISLFEAVIAVPLVALAHLTPRGEGLPGDRAKTAYYFMFSIFLRPVLMVFGLIASILVFYIGTSYLNMLYAMAVNGAGGLGHGDVAFSRVFYTVIYVLTLYMCANSSFKLISFLPEKALRWMGAEGASYGGVTHDPEAIQGVVAGLGAYFDKQIVSGMGAVHRAGGQALGHQLHTRQGNILSAGAAGFTGGAAAGNATKEFTGMVSGSREAIGKMESGVTGMLGSLLDEASKKAGQGDVTSAALQAETEKLKGEAMAKLGKLGGNLGASSQLPNGKK